MSLIYTKIFLGREPSSFNECSNATVAPARGKKKEHDQDYHQHRRHPLLEILEILVLAKGTGHFFAVASLPIT